MILHMAHLTFVSQSHVIKFSTPTPSLIIHYEQHTNPVLGYAIQWWTAWLDHEKSRQDPKRI